MPRLPRTAETIEGAVDFFKAAKCPEQALRIGQQVLMKLYEHGMELDPTEGLGIAIPSIILYVSPTEAHMAFVEACIAKRLSICIAPALPDHSIAAESLIDDGIYYGGEQVERLLLIHERMAEQRKEHPHISHRIDWRELAHIEQGNIARQTIIAMCAEQPLQ